MENRYNNFKVLITKISRKIHNIEESGMQNVDLKSQHISCLYYLYMHKKLMAKEIVDIYLEDKGQVSRSLDYLEKNDYIYCESSAKKRYNAYYLLTDKGLKVAEYVSLKIEETVNSAILDLSKEEREVMYKCLNKISDNLDKVLGK